MFKTIFYQVLVASALIVGAAGGAQAVTVAPLLTPGTPTDHLNLANSNLFGSFADSFDFSLSSSAGIATSVTRINISGTSTISDFTSRLFALGGATPLNSGTDQGSGLLITNSFSGFLAPGIYRLDIAGTGAGAFGTGGVYSGTLTVTPAVPEPEIWAMMLAGAGLVGFQLRRKSIAAKARAIG